jgi:hypothetical protein
MKKTIFIFLMAFSSISSSYAQEWFTTFDVAKRLALLQNKMLLVMWENTLDYEYLVMLVSEENVQVYIDINQNDDANSLILNSLIWEHFVPVILPESNYQDIYNEAKKTRSAKYLNKLQDDSIKIMDVNGNILNIESDYFEVQNLSLMIAKYALNTSFLKDEFTNYLKEVNVTTAFNLASKYLEFSIFVQIDVRPELIDLANIYFNEAEQFLEESDLNNKFGFSQRLEFIKIEEQLILNKPSKARRSLKRIDEDKIDSTNLSLYNFLNYTTFKLLKDEDEAGLWVNKLSMTDLKKAALIINKNI